MRDARPVRPTLVNLEGRRTTVLRRATFVTDWLQVTVRRDSRLPLGLLVGEAWSYVQRGSQSGCRTHFHRFLLVREYTRLCYQPRVCEWSQ